MLANTLVTEYLDVVAKTENKKLEGAALFWCGDIVIDETVSDAEALGIKGIPAPKQVEIYEIFPENWLSIIIFLDIQTQWRMDQGVIYGLDYNAIKWIFELKKDEIKNL